ncbi:MAG: myxococcus cysteine-rich repeat containing protein [bacterium]
MYRCTTTVVVLSCLALLLACGPSGSGDDDATVPDDGAPDDVTVGPDVLLPDTSVPDAYVPGCGNGTLDDGELCDDGNQVSGDGCNASCTMADGYDMVGAAFTDGDQLVPRVTLAGAALVMTWEDWGGIDPAGAGARVRTFTTDGAPQSLPTIGSTLDFPANTTSTGDQFDVAVAGHTDGRFIVVWTDASGTGGGGTDVRAQLFEADGSRIVNPQTGPADFVVNSTPTGTQQQPSVAVNDNGLILVVWSDDSATGADTSGWAVRGRLFDFTGTPQVNLETGSVDDFLVNQSTGGNQYRPAVSANGAVGWGVVWTDDTNMDGNGTGIVGGAFGAYGDHSLTADVLINTTTTGSQDHPEIATQPATGYVVVWTDDSRGADDPYFRGVRGRVFTTTFTSRINGVTMNTDDFQVNTLVEGSQQLPGIAVDPSDGSVIVVWQDGSASDGSWAGIRGRVFNVALSPQANALSADGSDFRINTTFAEAQLTPSVAVVNGQAICVWEDSSGALPDVSGVAVRYRLLPPLW